jgi:hypothetical protein
MLSLPSAAEPLLVSLSVAFTEPTFKRIVPLIVGAILTTGRRTVTGVLRTLGPLAPGHWSDYHRIFSRGRCALWRLSMMLARSVLRWTDPNAPVLLPVDDTVCQHRGKKVYGKGCHRDAVRSASRHLVSRWGHKWVVLTVVVQFPFTSRRWALPVLAALYRPEALDHREGRRHKTPSDLARQLCAVMIHWFPQRRFVLLGDGNFAVHGLARFCHRHRRHVTLVSRFYADAALPPKRRPGQTGRTRQRGTRLPAPEAVVANAKRQRATVAWYGGSSRRVEFVSGTGHWYKVREGLIPVRWVFTHDAQGTHRDDYFFATDPTLDPATIIGWFTARWPIETMFQEMRAQLALETPRQRVKNSVLRTAPCLFGLFSVVSLIYAEHVRTHTARPAKTAWYAKGEPTFSDAIAAVRRLFWAETVFRQPSHEAVLDKLPRRLRAMLLDQLARAA